MSDSNSAIVAQAKLHHAYLLGLQLMVATNRSSAEIGDWMFKLFRRQHQEKFLSSFEKLGLCDLPHAVACAHYHVMSNNIGGVPVEFLGESDTKAWVRFRYPRWMYSGPTICGVPIEVSRGFLEGWYAQNGVSLQNDCLGFVCVSEDMTGEFGFCGYFKEFDSALAENERLQFSRGELPPAFDAGAQPKLPNDLWNSERIEKANRNYAVEFIRNALVALAEVIGANESTELAARAARLIGLQYFQETNTLVGTSDGGVSDAAEYLQRMFGGLNDEVSVSDLHADGHITLRHKNLRIVKGLASAEASLVLDSWKHLWIGALSSYRVLKEVHISLEKEEVCWKINDRKSE